MYAKRTDANQSEIVKNLRTLGCSVYVTSMVGNGFPDLAVGIRGKTLLFEIKDGNKTKSQQKLSEKENDFHLTWKGHVAIIKNINDVIDILKNI